MSDKRIIGAVEAAIGGNKKVREVDE